MGGGTGRYSTDTTVKVEIMSLYLDFLKSAGRSDLDLLGLAVPANRCGIDLARLTCGRILADSLNVFPGRG